MAYPAFCALLIPFFCSLAVPSRAMEGDEVEMWTEMVTVIEEDGDTTTKATAITTTTTTVLTQAQQTNRHGQSSDKVDPRSTTEERMTVPVSKLVTTLDEEPTTAAPASVLTQAQQTNGHGQSSDEVDPRSTTEGTMEVPVSKLVTTIDEEPTTAAPASVLTQAQETNGQSSSGDEVSTSPTTEEMTEVLVSELVTTLDPTTAAPASDIRVTGLAPASSIEYKFDQNNTVSFSVTIENTGLVAIPEAEFGDNYRFTFILSGSKNLTETGNTVTEVPHGNPANASFVGGLYSGANLTFGEFELTLHVPAVGCVNYSYICVQVSKGSGANYSESDDSNNHACLKFGPFDAGFAGVYRCADIDTVGLEVTYLESSMLNFEVDNIVTYAVTVRNSGPFSIPAPNFGNNFNLSFMISNTSDPSSQNTAAVSYMAETSRALQLDAAVPSGTLVVIRDVDVIVSIPNTTCEHYQYMCVRVEKAANASYTDGNPDNNAICILFGDITQGYAGNLPCTGCSLETSVTLPLIMAMIGCFY